MKPPTSFFHLVALAGLAMAVALAVTLLAGIGCSRRPQPPPPSALAAGAATGEKAGFTPQVLRGGKLIAQNRCERCHRIEGEGSRKGIHLHNLLSLRTKKWLIAHFEDPARLVPGSKMPKFGKLPAQDLSDMADYLLALR